jgi:type II secretory pathway component PulF
MILTVLILRALMNGSLLSKLLMLVPGLVTPFTLASTGMIYATLNLGRLVGRSGRNAEPAINGIPAGVIVTALTVFLILLSYPWLLQQIELIILNVEKSFSRKFRYVPLFGQAVRAHQEAQWLGVFASVVTAGVPEADALKAAGKACGGSLERRSLAAAALARQGKLFGDACVDAKVLLPELNHRMVLIQRRSNLRQSLRNIADDAAQDAYETASRTGKIAEILAITATPILTGYFIIAIYLPLFNIPAVVMTTTGR